MNLIVLLQALLPFLDGAAIEGNFSLPNVHWDPQAVTGLAIVTVFYILIAFFTEDRNPGSNTSELA
jgi:hypothetical protein